MNELDTLKNKLSIIRKDMDQKLGQQALLQTRKASLEKEINTLKSSIITYDKAAIILNSIGESRQSNIQDQIEALVTRGLRMVFDESYSFHMIQKRGKRTVVEFVVKNSLSTGKFVETDLVDGRGGGVKAVVGFLLRLVVLLLSDRGSLISLDETFANLSEEHIPAMGEFIKELAEKTGIQVIMVTHQPEFTEYADKKYRFRLVNGHTQVTDITGVGE